MVYSRLFTVPILMATHYWDFVTGNISGGVVLYTSTGKQFIPGVNEIDRSLISAKIFPNPANDRVRIQIEGVYNGLQVRIQITDILGSTN